MKIIHIVIIFFIGLPAHGQPFSPHFWGASIEGMAQQFIFGYGSLVNSQSRQKTVERAVPAIPARISPDFGYRRGWFFRANSIKVTLLGIERVEQGSSINGVIFPVTDQELIQWDRRESGYNRIQVDSHKIELLYPLVLSDTAKVYIYVPSEKYTTTLPAVDYPLVQSYIDLCVSGFLEYHRDFAREFIETVFAWSPYWLNDRVMARRPWVFEKSHYQIDQLLQKFPADSTRNYYTARKLPVEYDPRQMEH